MMRAVTVAFALAALVSLTPVAADANTVMLGGAVYTLDPRHPWATAVVIDGGQIAYVGDDAGAAPYVHPDSRVIELAGRMVLPGFHDAHVHPMSAGMRLLRCQLSGLTNIDSVYDAVRACAASDKHAWLIGSGLPLDVFPAGGPAREKLDELVVDRPAYIYAADGFTAWANSAALAAGGIDPQTVAGLITGDTLTAVYQELPRPTEAEYREALRRTTAILNSFGVTSVFDASVSGPMAEAYHAADAARELTVRVVAAQLVDAKRGPEQVDDFIERRARLSGPRFRPIAAKIFLDGEIAYHTALMLRPYADAAHGRGPRIPQKALNEIAARLDARGFDIHMHAMGDGAVRAGLDAIANAERANGPRDRRPQIAHVGVAARVDIRRFAKLHVAANLSPGWFPQGSVAADTDRALGPARARYAMPAASIAARHGMIVLSSDWPATSMNPLDGIQFAVTRQPLDGHLPAHQPRERISLAAAIAAYTRNAAYVAREDDIDGTIEAGKAADLVVLDRNLFKVGIMDVHNVQVVLTLLDGEPVYRDAAFNWH